MAKGGGESMRGGSIQATVADPAITVAPVADGFDRPVFATAAPGDPDRLYVVEQHSGRILILDARTGRVNAAPFLDIPDEQLAQGAEQGLLGLAFHPDYAFNGRFFVYLTRADGDVMVKSYQRSAGDPDVASPLGNVILYIDKDNGATNHNGGWMGFGPDGMLYIAIGDEGGSGDAANNAQNRNALWGKLLRIDVDGDAFPGNTSRDYAIPADNPFAGAVPGAAEIWALGLRNPWRASFDRLTGDLYIGDVGQSAREEIDFQPAGSPGGANYGWKVMEGRTVFAPGVPGNPPPGSPALTGPVVDLPRDPSSGSAIVGGYVYRGESPGMQGRYVFTDFLTNRLWSFRIADGRAVELTDHTGQLTGGSLANITSFAEDGRGNLYAIGIGGTISRLDFGADSGGVLGASDTFVFAPASAAADVADSTPLDDFGFARTEALACADRLAEELRFDFDAPGALVIDDLFG